MGANFSAPVQTGPAAHPASYTMDTKSFPGFKQPGRGFKHPPHIAPRLKKNRAIPLLQIWAFVARYRVNFIFNFIFIITFIFIFIFTFIFNFNLSLPLSLPLSLSLFLTLPLTLT
jgi:hypothetical protein